MFFTSLLVWVGVHLAPAQIPSQPQPSVVATPMEWDSGHKTRRAPALQLTASDGSGLQLVAAKVDAVVDDPVARTEMTLFFDNPHNRVIEGHFEVTLPPDAAVGRFAMKVRGQWMEGEVVELQRARQVFEDHLFRRTDPALLEKDAGNQFRARVFPIAPRERKEILISWTEPVMDATTPWSVPVAGLGELEQLTASLTVWEGAKGMRRVSHRSGRTVANDNLVLRRQVVGDAGLMEDNAAVMRITPDLPAQAARPLGDLTVLVDTSASAAPDLSRALSHLQGLAKAMPVQASLRVIAFDQTQQTVFIGSPAHVEDAVDALRRRGAMGASDLGGALRALATAGPTKRVLLLGDGIATAGPERAPELAQLVAALSEAGVERMDCWAPGDVRDETVLSAMARALPDAGTVIRPDHTLHAALERLQRSTHQVTIDVPGAAWFSPEQVDVQPGESVVIRAMMQPGTTPTLALNGQRHPTPPMRTAQDPGTAARTVAHSRIADLERLYSETQDPSVARQIVQLSVAHRVVSDLTSWLVLESAADYRRYGLRQADGDLKPGASTEEIVVEARRAAIDVQQTSSSEVLTKDFLQRLPAGRSYQSAVGLSAGVTGGGGNKSIGGGATNENTYMLDGANITDPVTGTFSVNFDFDALERTHSDIDMRQPEFGGVLPQPNQRPTLVLDQIRPRHIGTDGHLISASEPDSPGLSRARARQRARPADLPALLVLAQAAHEAGRHALAARAAGSLIDLHPSRAEIRRAAASLLQRAGAEELALDSLEKAAENRPDHGHGVRMQAMALARVGALDDAIHLMENWLRQPRSTARNAQDVSDLMSADLQVLHTVRDHRQGQVSPTRLAPSTRVVLTWETNANDVDLHIWDPMGDHAYYASHTLPSGGALWRDVTTGYGPEVFEAASAPLRGEHIIGVKYFNQGAAGLGLGQVEVMHHDGKAGLSFLTLPFALSSSHERVEVGRVDLSRIGAGARSTDGPER